MKDFKQLPKDFQAFKKMFEQHGLNTLGRIVETEGMNHFEESWDNQGFTDQSLQKWRQRKEPQRKVNKSGRVSRSYERWHHKNEGRAILVGHQSDVDGTHLKDSGTTKRTKTQVSFMWPKAYAQVHNEGGRAGRGKGFDMTKRQYAGKSKVLDDKVLKRFNQAMNNYFKNL